MVIEYTGNVIRSVLTDKREKYYESRVGISFMFEDKMINISILKVSGLLDPRSYSLTKLPPPLNSLNSFANFLAF